MSHSGGQVKLDELLRELRAGIRASDSPVVEARLRGACRERARERHRRRRLAAGLATLAACLAFVLLGWWRGWERRPVPDAAAANAGTSAAGAYRGFLALPYAQTDVPMEQTTVVHLNLQPGDFDALGLPSTIPRRNARVPAELLVGQDGVARAVRFDSPDGQF